MPLLLSASRDLPQAFMLGGVSSDLVNGVGGGIGAYTKASLTETTKTLPALESLGCATKPGMWESEHVGPGRVSFGYWVLDDIGR